MSAPAMPLTGEQIELWRRRIREDVSSNYHFEMGTALAAQGEIQPAVDQFQRALAARPDFPLAFRTLQLLLIQAQRLEEAEAVRQAALRANPDHEAASRLAEIERLEGRDDLDAANRLVAELLEIAPGRVEALHWQAYLAARAGSIPLPASVAALPALDAPALRRTLADRYRWVSLPHLERRHLGKVIRLLDIARFYDPEEWNSASRHAAIMLCVGRMGEAVDLLDALLDAASSRKGIEPPETDLIVRANLAAGRVDRATALAEAALAGASSTPDVRSLLGLCAANRGDWRASEAILREALAAKPDDAFARTNLGLALQGQGRLAEAIEAHRAALAIQRDDPWTHTNLGLALAAAGDAAGALDAHRTAIALGRPFLLYTLPQRRWALDELMRVYRELGAFEAGESGNVAG